jgi:hypothetical protein
LRTWSTDATFADVSPHSEQEAEMAPSVIVTQVLVASAVLFVIAYVGNRISFSSRFANALVTALIFAVIYGVLAYTVDKTVLPPELKEADRQIWLQMILTGAALVFVLDLVANLISFRNRVASAFVTAALFAILFGVAIYATGGAPPQSIPT